MNDKHDKDSDGQLVDVAISDGHIKVEKSGFSWPVGY